MKVWLKAAALNFSWSSFLSTIMKSLAWRFPADGARFA